MLSLQQHFMSFYTETQQLKLTISVCERARTCAFISSSSVCITGTEVLICRVTPLRVKLLSHKFIWLFVGLLTAVLMPSWFWDFTTCTCVWLALTNHALQVHACITFLLNKNVCHRAPQLHRTADQKGYFTSTTNEQFFSDQCRR